MSEQDATIQQDPTTAQDQTSAPAEASPAPVATSTATDPAPVATSGGTDQMVVGIQGPQGEPGPTGPQGPKGDKGDPGESYSGDAFTQKVHAAMDDFKTGLKAKLAAHGIHFDDVVGSATATGEAPTK